MENRLIYFPHMPIADGHAGDISVIVFCLFFVCRILVTDISDVG